jgi:hypothetical protein
MFLISSADVVDFAGCLVEEHLLGRDGFALLDHVYIMGGSRYDSDDVRRCMSRMLASGDGREDSDDAGAVDGSDDGGAFDDSADGGVDDSYDGGTVDDSDEDNN